MPLIKKKLFSSFIGNKEHLPNLPVSLSFIKYLQLHRPERKMRQNAVMICISYNYVSSSLLDVLS